MLIYDSSDFITFTPRILTESDISKLYIPNGQEEIIDSICEVNGKYYYYKGVDFDQLINELIGSLLSKMVGLDAVDYKIGVCNNELYALSEIFYKPGFQYYDCEKFFGKIADHKLTESDINAAKDFFLEDSMFNLITNPKMLLNLLKLTIIDIKMGQIDRNNLGNIIVKEDKTNGLIDLAPIIDFECSYDSSPPFPEFSFYDNPFIVILKSEQSIATLVRKYPQIMETVRLLANLKMEEILLQIQSEKKIKLSMRERKYYEGKDRDYSKVLQKVI